MNLNNAYICIIITSRLGLPVFLDWLQTVEFPDGFRGGANCPWSAQQLYLGEAGRIRLQLGVGEEADDDDDDDDDDDVVNDVNDVNYCHL